MDAVEGFSLGGATVGVASSAGSLWDPPGSREEPHACAFREAVVRLHLHIHWGTVAIYCV
jgi:hypothetical protein